MAKPLINTVTALITGATVSTVWVILPATAGQFSNGRTFFDRSPKLVRATTSNPATQFPSTYKFTLTVPADAGAPLQAITITQKSATEQVRFDVSRSVAFARDRYGVGSRLSLASIGGTEPSTPAKTTLVFDPPVPPGTTVTIKLEAKRNPSAGGIYLFGVTAYPVGEPASGLFLGYGRLTFYDNAR